MGYKVVDAADVSGNVPSLMASEQILENDLLRVTFAEDGSILSVYDKDAEREAIAEGKAANRLAVYTDYGDAWDFPMDYAETEPRHMQLVSATPGVDGPRATLIQVYQIGDSELVQEISMSAGCPRLDFCTRVRWRETASMLRTSFPVAVHAEEATFEIQYGHLRRPTHRNTTWDLARDEVVAHKWADLSQRDYGVALLNDCKYGYKVKGNVLDLNLLRSAPYPGPRLVRDEDVLPGEPHHGYTDQNDHEFTYALYPHRGDHVAGGVIRAGYELNVPLRVASTEARPGHEPREISFLQVDVSNVIVEAVKQAEEGDALIVRLYECEGRDERASVQFGFPVRSVAEVDLMEENPQPREMVGDGVVIALRPFEIKTLRVEA
jgi:alpha-mannosidase